MAMTLINRVANQAGNTHRGTAMVKGHQILLGIGAATVLAVIGGCTGSVPQNQPAVNGSGATGNSAPTGSGGSPGAVGGVPGHGGTVGVGTGGTTIVGGSGAAGPAACTASASLAPARIWRITDEQYVNVVAQVFGVRVPPEVTEADTQPADYTNFSEAPKLTVQASVANAYQLAAHNAALGAVTANLAVFLPCGQVAPTDACVERFIRNRVARAFARPVTDAEVTDLLALYHAGLVDNVATGIRLIIEATLQSPSFLYRTEIGASGAGGGSGLTSGSVTLTATEVADAVSFSLLDSVPDDSLWQKALDGSLLNPGVLASEVDRLLASPAVQTNLGNKAGFWLGVEKLRSIVPKNTTLFPEFTAELKQNLYDSAKMFVGDLLTHGNLSDLLTSRRMYVNANLAKVYGIPGVTGTSLVPMDVQLPERSAGILTQPAVLAAWSHPDRGDVVHRGLFIYNALVCGSTVPAPPANAATVAATFPKDATERELANLRATNAAGCGACHALFDPLGLATERYDPIGRYNMVDAANKVIDSSTVITRLGPDLDGPVADLPDLVAKLKSGKRVSECAARNLAVFVLGRSVVDDHSCALQQVKDRFAATGTFTDYYRAMLTSPGFGTRDVGP